MLIYMWIGGAILLFGVAVVLWPDANPYPVFAASRRKKRKVAAGAATPHGELITNEAEPSHAPVPVHRSRPTSLLDIPCAEQGKGVFSAEDWAQLEDEASELLVQRDRLIEELRDIEFEAATRRWTES